MIHNETAYEAGRARAIKRNASKSRGDKWRAANADAETLSNWLWATGEFQRKAVTKDPVHQAEFDTKLKALENNDGYWSAYDDLFEQYSATPQDHPLCRGMFGGDFGAMLIKMRDAIDEWGGLSDAQTEVVRNALARKRTWVAEAAIKMEERRVELSGKGWIGEPKGRIHWDLKVNKVLSFDSQWGMTYIHLCETSGGEQVIYKGSKRLIQGDAGQWAGKATVNAHDIRDGIKQTIIARPKSDNPEEEGY